jgi:DNA-binding NtrC family response regulator
MCSDDVVSEETLQPSALATREPLTIAVLAAAGALRYLRRSLQNLGHRQAELFIDVDTLRRALRHAAYDRLIVSGAIAGNHLLALAELMLSRRPAARIILIGTATQDANLPCDDRRFARLDLPIVDSALARAIDPDADRNQRFARRRDAFSEIVTQNAAMADMFRLCEAVAPTAEPVLITGETGTGKELVAKAVHRLSERVGAFVAINVAGYDDTMFADALFGHRKGAFTGASDPRPGMILRASGGTLFLDEIGDLSLPSQVKLLRLLQEHEYLPLGADEPKLSTARIVVATSRDLRQAMKQGTFRPDLYYRLRTHHVHLPPLRERSDDIPLLCEHFLGDATRAIGRRPCALPHDVREALCRHRFPGNVRELRAMIFDAVSRSSDGRLPLTSFQSITAGTGPDVASLFSSQSKELPGRLPTLAELDRQYAHIIDRVIAEALKRSGNNQAQAAALLGITRQALNRRLNLERSRGTFSSNAG